jgi:hypothetical protein
MKKRSKTTTVIVAVAVAGLPLPGIPELWAQRPAIERPAGPSLPKAPPAIIKHGERFSKTQARQAIVGIDNGIPVYQNARGELFTLIPETGDLRFLGPDDFAGFRELSRDIRPGAPLRMAKWPASKWPGEVAIVGIDETGHVVHQNARGERFYLDPATGDMVYVK